MALFDKLKEELDRAGRVAQGALDEGKVRIEAFRTRQLADKAAQALGYAVFRAKQGGSDVDADTYGRLSATLATHDAEASRYENELEEKRKESRSARESGSREPATSAGADDISPATSSTSSTSSGSAASSTGGASSSTASPYASETGSSPSARDMSG